MNIKTSANFVPGNIAAILQTVTAANFRATTKASEIVMNQAKENCPVGDTGDLQESIEMNVTLKGLTVTGIVGSDSPHAQFVEYGTGVKGIGTYPYSLPQTGVPITGGWVYDYKKQNWQGHKSQAYLRPALDESGSAILDCYKSEGLI